MQLMRGRRGLAAQGRRRCRDEDVSCINYARASGCPDERGRHGQLEPLRSSTIVQANQQGGEREAQQIQEVVPLSTQGVDFP